MLKEPTRAFLRHAVRWWYADLTHVNETAGAIFMWEATFCKALEGFRSAVLRHARTIRLHHTHRAYTNLQGVVPESERARFTSLVQIREDGSYQLTAAFTKAVDDARAEYDRLKKQSG